MKHLKAFSMTVWIMSVMMTLATVMCLFAQDLSLVLPEIKTMPAPASITAGLRLNYYYQEGSDDFATHGVFQLDVIGLTPQWAGLSLAVWPNYMLDGPLVKAEFKGLLSYAGGGEWWVHPEILAKVAETNERDFKILRMSMQVLGQTYPVLRVQRETASDMNVMAFDLQTGYLVYWAIQEDLTGSIKQIFFKGVRQIRFPWEGEPLPSWVIPGKELSYKGSLLLEVIGCQPQIYGMSADMKITASAGDWFYFDQRVRLPFRDFTTTYAAGANHTPPLLCLPVTFLQRAVKDQVIDYDDVTNTSVYVSNVGRLNGRPSVTIRTVTANQAGKEIWWWDSIFDASSGVMVVSRIANRVSATTHETYELNLTSQLPTNTIPTSTTTTIRATTTSTTTSTTLNTTTTSTISTTTTTLPPEPKKEWRYFPVKAGSEHPYANNSNDLLHYYWEKGAERVAVHFSRFELEDGKDYLMAYDHAGQLIEKYTGTRQPFWVVSESESIWLVLASNESINAYGYHIDWVACYK